MEKVQELEALLLHCEQYISVMTFEILCEEAEADCSDPSDMRYPYIAITYRARRERLRQSAATLRKEIASARIAARSACRRTAAATIRKSAESEAHKPRGASTYLANAKT